VEDSYQLKLKRPFTFSKPGADFGKPATEKLPSLPSLKEPAPKVEHFKGLSSLNLSERAME